MELAPCTITMDLHPSCDVPPKPDDYVVSIGATRSGTVYHVAEAFHVQRRRPARPRYRLTCYRAPLSDVLRRRPGQTLFTMHWNRR